MSAGSGTGPVSYDFLLVLAAVGSYTPIPDGSCGVKRNETPALEERSWPLCCDRRGFRESSDIGWMWRYSYSAMILIVLHSRLRIALTAKALHGPEALHGPD